MREPERVEPLDLPYVEMMNLSAALRLEEAGQGKVFSHYDATKMCCYVQALATDWKRLKDENAKLHGRLHELRMLGVEVVVRNPHA